MTGQDVDNLFELLAIFRPGDKHLGDKKLRSAWLFVLKPYAPEDVREAVAQYFREASYWPDVTDIAKRCPKVIPVSTREALPSPDDKHWKRQQELAERYDDLKRRRREAGFPENVWDAKKAGLTMEEYDKAVDDAGLGFDTIM